MGEAFTVQITANLVRHLVGDDKKVEKKSRKPEPVINREPQHSKPSDPPMQISDVSKSTLPPTPDQKPANAELDAALAFLDASEKAVERLQKQEEEDTSKEITRKADDDTDDKEFKHPEPAVISCLDEEKDTCSKCNNEKTKDPLKFTDLVEGFAECRRKFRQQVGILKDFLGQFRDK